MFNNAGVVGGFAAVEQTTLADARAVFETNVIANLAVLHAALPSLRSSKGHIVQTSSQMGMFAWPSTGVYSASKAALTLLSEALALELAPLGVKVTIIEPGLFGTDLWSKSSQVAANDVYAESVGKFVAQFAQLPAEAYGDPAAVADAVVAVTKTDQPPLHLPIGQDSIDGIREKLQARLAELDAQHPADGA